MLRDKLEKGKGKVLGTRHSWCEGVRGKGIVGVRGVRCKGIVGVRG